MEDLKDELDAAETKNTILTEKTEELESQITKLKNQLSWHKGERSRLINAA